MHRISPSFPSLAASRNAAPRRVRSRHTLRLVAGAACLMVAVALAGCGVTIDMGGHGGVSSSPPQQAPSGGTAVRPCTGDSVIPSKKPALVLTVNDSNKTAQAHVGDVIEVRLDMQTHWFPPNITATSALTAIQPQGAIEPATQTCRWFFEAKAAGKATLEFTGAPICESNTPCPAIARAEKFIIQVS